MSACTNTSGGPYTDATYAKVRPEHDPVAWHEARKRQQSNPAAESGNAEH